MSLRPGELFAGYTIERELGGGGMGEVYLARHPRLPRFDALKLLRPELCDDRNFVGRFEREADTVAQLDHPNIVPVYDRGSADGQLWISMRFIDGTNAEKALVDYAQGMPPERAARIVARVASALDYAHRNQLLHRDVKPANILLAQGTEDDDETERVFLSDFGVAKAIGAAADRLASLTSTGSVVATLDYASPEQIKGRTLDHRSDVYALGCVLYKLLTGTVPFPGESIATRVYGHLNSVARAPSSLVEGLPTGFDEVVVTAMAKESDDRYPTCRALAQAAHAALTGSTVKAPIPATDPEADRRTTVALRSVERGRPTRTPPTGTPPPGTTEQPSEPLPAWISGRQPATGRPTGVAPSGTGSSSTPGRPLPGPVTWPDGQVAHASGPAPAGSAVPPPSARPSAVPPPAHRSAGDYRRFVWVAAAVAAVVVVVVVASLVVRDQVGGTAAPTSGGTAASATDAGTVQTGSPTFGPSPTPVAVTSSDPVPGLPHAAPLADQVVVVPQVVDGVADLYAVDVDSAGSVARITTGATDPLAPVLSPDRGSLVYVQPAVSGGGLRTVAVDGSDDRALWDGRPTDCQTYGRPAWNPIDQTRLAVVCVTTKGEHALSEIGVDGTVHATFDTGLATVDDVAYSPDGTILVYRGTDSVGASTSAIYTQPADGSAAPTMITDGAAVESAPMFSPDGSRIVFTRAEPAGTGSTILTMNTDGSDPVPLTEGTAHDQDPAWSPDGTRIVFRSDRSTGDPNALQFWVMQGNGQEPTPLTSNVTGGPPAWGRR